MFYFRFKEKIFSLALFLLLVGSFNSFSSHVNPFADIKEFKKLEGKDLEQQLQKFENKVKNEMFDSIGDYLSKSYGSVCNDSDIDFRGIVGDDWLQKNYQLTMDQVLNYIAEDNSWQEKDKFSLMQRMILKDGYNSLLETYKNRKINFAIKSKITPNVMGIKYVSNEQIEWESEGAKNEYIQLLYTKDVLVPQNYDITGISFLYWNLYRQNYSIVDFILEQNKQLLETYSFDEHAKPRENKTIKQLIMGLDNNSSGYFLYEKYVLKKDLSIDDNKNTNSEKKIRKKPAYLNYEEDKEKTKKNPAEILSNIKTYEEEIKKEYNNISLCKYITQEYNAQFYNFSTNLKKNII